MAGDPLFSILLPTHNRADVLPFAIHSVLEQSIQDFELLVVGDGCTDETAKIVKSFADPRIIWFNLPKGPNFGYANRNIALRQARGIHIAFMAHDDLWLPDHLALLLPLLEKPDIEIVYSRPLWVLPDGKIAPAVFDLNEPSTLEVFLAKTKNRIPASCVVHRKECFAKYGYWDETLPAGADWNMWIRIIEGGGRKNFIYFPEATCLHFRADWRKKRNFILEHETVWEKFYALGNFALAPMHTPVPEGITEQQAIWQAISARSQEWAGELRTAIRLASDRRVGHSDELIAWMIKRWPKLTCDVASLTQHMQGMLEHQATQKTHLARFKQQTATFLERQAALQADLSGLKEQNAALSTERDNLETELLRLGEQIAALSSRHAALEAQLARPGEFLAQDSLALKLVHKLRAARLFLAPPGTSREKLWLRMAHRLKKIM